MAPPGRRYTLQAMSVKSMVTAVPRGWAAAAGLATVAAATVAGGYAEANPRQHYGGLHLTSHPPLAAYLLLIAAALALAWRNARPVTVLGVTVAAAAGWAALGQIDGAALVPVIVALYWVALTRPRRVAIAAGLAGAVAIFMTEGLLGPFGWLGGPNATMWPELLAAGAVGAAVAARRQWLAAERDRAAQAEQTREEETRRRVDAERMRIARELHDVVAHSISMINVQATAAGLQLAEDPAAAAEAIQAIRGASKSALRELRAILDVLRVVDGGGPAVPVPDLRALAALAEATTAAGTPTTLDADGLTAGGPNADGVPADGVPADGAQAATRQAATRHGEERQADGPPGPLPPPVALAAYRIVQESLTNVVRHAGRVPTTVILRRAGGDLQVEVVNEGGATPAAFADGAGAGLAGMRERATALGGTLEAGPRPGGGFAVRARLPLAAGAPPAPAGTPAIAGQP
jgi:signal transduction histidine kinase